jgi:cytochrome c oxidase subunit 2
VERTSPAPLRRELVELAATAALAAGLVLAAWAANTADRAPTPAAAAAPLAAQGRQLFQSKGCVGCHSAPGMPALAQVGPDLRDLRAEAASRRPPLTAAEYVRQSVREPAFVREGFVYGTEMPKLDVSDRELEALVAFVLGSPS